MGNSYMKSANLTASHGSRGLREYRQQNVSTLPGCINRVLRSKLSQAAENRTP